MTESNAAQLRMALRVKALSKTFSGTKALDDVSFEVGASDIHGLLGGNGCGKSTLIKILAGVLQSDAGGTFEINGAATASDSTSPELARMQGLRFVHQNASTFTDMTVAENIAIGGPFPTQVGRINWRALKRHTQALLDRFEIDARPDDRLCDLRAADQTMIAIARALQDVSTDSEHQSVLVLDEPTASLPEHEVNILLHALRRYAAQGQTILYVSHRIDEVMSITDSITVLRDGRHVITRPTEGLTESQLIEHIVGSPLTQAYATAEVSTATDRVMSVRNLNAGPLKDISFDIRKGEILGFAGLLGSGRTELLHALFGSLPRESGEIEVNGQVLKAKTAGQSMASGIALVPEDRVAEAAFMDMPVRQNLSIAKVSRYSRRGVLRASVERTRAAELIKRFSIRTAGDDALLSSLSGGNQQKVVLARWLQRDPAVLLLDEPTQGVDVGARADVYSAVRQAVTEGMAAILVTSDFEELAMTADRVLVMSNGRICAEVTGDQLTRHNLTELVFSANEKGSAE